MYRFRRCWRWFGWANGWIVGEEGLVRRTSDGGKSWADVEGIAFDLRGLFFLDAEEGWLVGDQGMIVKVDGKGGGAGPAGLSGRSLN